MRDRFLRTLPLLLLLSVWFVLFSPLLLHGQFYLSADGSSLLRYFPLYHLMGESIRDGQLPLWTPLLSQGYPFMAEGSAGTMYPLNLFLFRYFAPYTGYQAALAIAPLVSLITCYYYLAYKQYSRLAAFLGASCFAFGGFAVSHLRHLFVLQAMSMLPLALLFAERYIDRRRLSEALLCASAVAVAIMAGGMDWAYICGLTLWACVLLRGAEQPDPASLVGVPLSSSAGPLKRLLLAHQLLLVVLVAAGLVAAPQILILADLWGGEGATGAALSKLSEGAPSGFIGIAAPEYFPRFNLLILQNFLSPLWHGSPLDETFVHGDSYWETLFNVGFIPTLLALLALVVIVKGRRNARLALLLVGVGGGMAFGGASLLQGWIQGSEPGSPWPIPGRFLVLCTLGLSGLAATGMDFLREVLESDGRSWALRAAAVLPGLCLTLTVLELAYVGQALTSWVDKSEVLERPATAEAMPGLGPYRLLSVAGSELVDAASSRVPQRKAPGSRFYHARTLDRSRQPSAVESELDVSGQALSKRNHLKLGRALLTSNYNLVHDIAKVGSRVGQPLPFRGWLRRELLSQLKKDANGGLSITEAGMNLVKFFGVRVFMSDVQVSHPELIPLEPVPVEGLEEPIRLYGLEEPYPRAYLARELTRCSPDVAMGRLREGHFGSGWAPCILDEGATELPEEESSGVAGYMTITSRGLSFIEYSVNMLNPGYIVVRDSYAPGWQSWVNEVEAETLRVDLLYRATSVPKGRSKVRQEYRPTGLGIGLGMNLLGLILVTLGIMASRANAQRQARMAESQAPDWRDSDRWFT